MKNEIGAIDFSGVCVCPVATIEANVEKSLDVAILPDEDSVIVVISILRTDMLSPIQPSAPMSPVDALGRSASATHSLRNPTDTAESF